MRIKSNFVDYYDSLQRLGGESSDLLYVRQLKEFTGEDKDLPQHLLKNKDLFSGPGSAYRNHRTYRKKEPAGLFFEPIKALFAGFLYQGYRIKVESFNRKPLEVAFKDLCIWTTAEWLKVKTVLNYSDMPLTFRPRGRPDRLSIESLLEAAPKDLRELSYKENLPVAIFYPGRYNSLLNDKYMTCIELNGNLKNIQFYKKFDAASAYQELAMWYSNQAPEMKPLVQIEDKYKVQEHGFDKWSFRKQPKDFKG